MQEHVRLPSLVRNGNGDLALAPDDHLRATCTAMMRSMQRWGSTTLELQQIKLPPFDGVHFDTVAWMVDTKKGLDV